MSEARRLLGQAMRAFGQDGGLVLFKDPEDPFGLDKGPVLHSYVPPARTTPSDRGEPMRDERRPWIVAGGEDDSNSGNKHGGGGSEGDDSGHSDTNGSGSK
ncbi:hypothetical protein [Streptomyces virginiae]|uniref:Uncharacterized protein n=1 Tax=Streptomyces virginiae TaxID=1961 RepID=A0ABZ1TA41_STRVG|nr:hypothetical protein [Streptomyces virginiae]